jgi:hypothetical protein
VYPVLLEGEATNDAMAARQQATMLDAMMDP